MGDLSLKGQFIGGDDVKMDEAGRFVLPVRIKRIFFKYYGNKIFITSINGENILIYPLRVWKEWLRSLNVISDFDPEKMKLLERVNYFGEGGRIDGRGRILLSARIREYAKIHDMVSIVGATNHIVVWDSIRFKSEHIDSDKMTNDELKNLTNRLSKSGY